MKIKLAILLLIAYTIAGCQREPMIHLSEENQSIVESKRMKLTGESNLENTHNEETIESTSEETSEEQTQLSIDTSSWISVEGNPELTLTDYLPTKAYDIKDFSNGQEILTTYPIYIDEERQLMQVEKNIQGDRSLIFYNWGSVQIVSLGEEIGLNPFINHLEQEMENNNKQEILLQSPLQIGGKWQRTQDIVSEITGIYSKGKINELDFTNIIEVKTSYPDGDLIEYYSESYGLIGQISDESQWIIQGIYSDSRLVEEIPFYIPTKENNQEKLTVEMVPFRWQTNQNFSSSFQKILQNLKIIDESIKVQDVNFENKIVYFDFSPGVVAVLNKYNSSEVALITALVSSLGEFFGSDQIRLTVNGNGMLPQTIDYPTNGIYNVKEMKDNLVSSQESDNETTVNESSESLNLNLPFNNEE